jgi:hypothetical protein
MFGGHSPPNNKKFSQRQGNPCKSKIIFVICHQGMNLIIGRKSTINLYDQIDYPASAGPLNGG